MKAEQEILLKLVTDRMPFGKYKDRILADLPVHYLEWFARKGFPPGKLGEKLALVLEIKSNGLDNILTNLKKLV